MIVKKIILLLVITFSMYQTSEAHTEITAQLSFVNYNNELYLRATLDKRHLVLALKTEGDCSAETMLKVCGEAYFKKSVSAKVNGKSVSFEKTSFEVEQNQIVINYKLKPNRPIESISVTSDYMVKYNSHGAVRVSFEINDKVSSYNMNFERKNITANFK